MLAATDPEAAFEHFAHDRPDLVIVSLDLPACATGGHLAQRIQEAEHGHRTPVVVYDRAHLGKARGMSAVLGLGAHAYLADPTRHPELRERLGRLLEARAGRRADRTEAAPIATGEVTAGRLPELLVESWRARRTGVLALEDGVVSRAIHFLDGAPSGYRSSLRAESLPRWLLERGDLDEDRYRALLEVMAADGLSPSGALVATGALDAGAPVYDVLRDHAREMILRATRLERGRFRFVPGREAALEIPALEIAPLPILHESARRYLPMRELHAALAGRLDRYPWRTEAFGRLLDALGLGTADLAFAMKITGQVTARELVTEARSRMKEAMRLLWYLDRVGAVAFSETAHASDEAQVYHAAAGAGRKKKPMPEALVAELTDEGVRILTASYFGVLGVDIAAGVEEVERAYHDLATRFHPETYDAYDLAPVEDLLQSVLDRITAAYRVLSVEEKRKGYLSYLLSRQETAARRAPPEVDAEIALRRGLNLVADEDWTGAAEAFADAVATNPREPEYYCHLAFARFKAARGPSAQRAKEPRKLLKKALALAPELERAHVLLGIVEQEVGERRTARRHFLKALELNPKSTTAKAALQRLDRVS